VRFGARQQGGREFADRWALQALVRAGFRTSLQRMGGSGRQQQKHAGGAPAVPNRRGDEDVDTRGSREGTRATKEDAPKSHCHTTGSLLLALRSDGHAQLAAAGPGTP